MNNFRRFYSKLIDLLIPTITSTIGFILAETLGPQGLKISESISLILFIAFAYLLYISFCIFFSKRRTLGEQLLGIQSSNIKDGSFSLSKFIWKEILYSFFVFYSALFSNGWIGLVLITIPIIKIKDSQYLLMPIDIIFKVKYKNIDALNK